MIYLRITDDTRLAPGSSFDLIGEDSPELAIPRLNRRQEFVSSVLALLRGPTPPKEFLGAPYFRDCWIEQRSPKAAFATAVVCQVLLILFPPSVWNIPASHAEPFAPQMELTWYGPAKDFPAILPALRSPKAAPRSESSKIPPHRGANALSPTQAIISEALHPTHPRQTLIQPAAPPEPPKMLPQLPNIVRLAGSEPARPRLQLSTEQLAAMRPKVTALRTANDSAAPEMSTQEKQAGEINISSSAQSPPKPALPVSPMSAPRAAHQRGDANAAAPEVAQQSTRDATTLIALSATPALVPPPPSAPAGNLSARISVSPEASQPGSPGAPTEGNNANAGSVRGGGRRGPEGILVGGGNGGNTAAASGLGIGAASRAPGNTLPSRPVPRASISPNDSNAPRFNPGPVQEGPKLDVPPEKILGAKRVYTLHVNMPNLTSASGSWVLNFAELNETGGGSAWSPAEKGGGSAWSPAQKGGGSTWSPPEKGAGSTLSSPGIDAATYPRSGASDLAGPVALRKVDPKYPPELRTAHVEGEVILYAIIRKDGTVDSIQLVHGVDSHLDVNAMEALSQWKFQPAEKHGEPIDLEAVVHIPFRSRAPAF